MTFFFIVKNLLNLSAVCSIVCFWQCPDFFCFPAVHVYHYTQTLLKFHEDSLEVSCIFYGILFQFFVFMLFFYDFS